MNKKPFLLTVIFQYVSAAVLIGLAVYYYVVGTRYKVILFGAVGALFIVLPTLAVIRYFSEKKNKKDGEDPPGKGFI